MYRWLLCRQFGYHDRCCSHAVRLCWIPHLSLCHLAGIKALLQQTVIRMAQSRYIMAINFLLGASLNLLFFLFSTEVVGAVVSVAIIWVITGVLFYEAVLRVIHPERFEVNADIMLITACIGVYVNVL